MAAFWTSSTEIRLVITIIPDAGIFVATGQGAGQLVESVMPSDILAQRNKSDTGSPETGGMDGSGFGVQGLPPGHGEHGGLDLVGTDDDARADLRRDADRFGEAFETAEATTSRSREKTPSLFEAAEQFRADPHPALDPGLDGDNL